MNTLLLAALLRAVFVDGNQTGGVGTREQPFRALADAQRANADVIYVAAMSTPYEENISLKKGQTLSGIDGPVIHGRIELAGDNKVEGVTVLADSKTGVAISADAPAAPIALQSVSVRVSGGGFALYLGSATAPFSWTNGSIDASAQGAGLLIAGGLADATFDHVAISGDFSRAIEIRDRTGGNVVFRDAPIRIASAARDCVVATSVRGSLQFTAPVQIQTNGSRGVVVSGVQKFSVTGDHSWIESENGTALDVRDTTADVHLDHVDARGVAPGRLVEGVTGDKIRGRFAIDKVTIENALSYGIRLTQSNGVHIANVTVSGGGSLAAGEECSADVATLTNLRCRAGLYLRHVSDSTFDKVTIRKNAGVGVNLNNVSDVRFTELHVESAGDKAAEPALLIDEARGPLAFTQCSLIDAAGGGVVIEQRFNRARIDFDRCEIAAPERPTAAEALLNAHVDRNAGLDLGLSGVEIHDNAGSAARIEATGNAAATLTMTGSRVHRVGNGVEFRLGGAATGCVETAENQLAAATGPAFRLVAGRQAALRVFDRDRFPFLVEGIATPVTSPCR